ncbi:helix-turn-helix domain-containing protein [Frankia casuarinae]|uniref:helix-turn-helix domain-containing protein n=1 Tax=Frankia casuarinae (strain DSM 45818 / CECT 9043 / HFP020203 / CcI3) TaxID=106370 RepID=UPI0010544827|nr:helix-turn-helix domain-containing protein [Frankia casuarinae]
MPPSDEEEAVPFAAPRTGGLAVPAANEPGRSPVLTPAQRVGAAMRQAREGRGFSLRYMGDKIGRHHSTLSPNELGNTMATDKTLQLYEEALHLPSGSLVQVKKESLSRGQDITGEKVGEAADSQPQTGAEQSEPLLSPAEIASDRTLKDFGPSRVYTVQGVLRSWQGRLFLAAAATVLAFWAVARYAPTFYPLASPVPDASDAQALHCS